MSKFIDYRPLVGDGLIRLDLERRLWHHAVVPRHEPRPRWLEDDAETLEEISPATETIEDVLFLFPDDLLVEYACVCTYDPNASPGYIHLDAFRDLNTLTVTDYTWKEGYREVDEARLRELGVHLPKGLLLPRNGQDGRAVQPPANDERDRYIYDQYLLGVPFKDIIKGVNDNSKWEPFNSEDLQGQLDAAHKAMGRYCDRHGLPKPMRKSRRSRRNST